MEKETAMKILKELHGKSLFAERTALETLIPELAKSEDEKIRKALVRFHKSTIDIDGIKGADILAWLEKQCYSKKDVDDAYLKGICDAKHELEKQDEQKPAAWSDEDEENLQHCCMAISADGLHTYEDKQEMEVWLKSLKDRIGG